MSATRFHVLRALLAITTLGISLPLCAEAADGLPGYVVLGLPSLSHSSLATIRVNVNGRATLLLLDTGATHMFLDRSFLTEGARLKSAPASTSELPPELRKGVKVNGEEAEIATVDDLKAGPLDFGRVRVVTTDLSGMVGGYNNMHRTDSISGAFGIDIMRKYAAVIDWRRRGVYFNTDPSKRIKMGPGLISSGWTAVPMSIGNSGRFTVACSIEGKPARLLVDTGAQFTVFVPNMVPLTIIYNRDMKSSMERLGSATGLMNAIGLDATIHPARVTHWKLGNYEIDSTIVAAGKAPPGTLEEKSSGEGPMIGLLGAEVLAANNALIDVAGATLYLKHK